MTRQQQKQRNFTRKSKGQDPEFLTGSALQARHRSPVASLQADFSERHAAGHRERPVEAKLIVEAKLVVEVIDG